MPLPLLRLDILRAVRVECSVFAQAAPGHTHAPTHPHPQAPNSAGAARKSFPMGAVTSAEAELPAGRDAKACFRRWGIADVRMAYTGALQTLAVRHARVRAMGEMHLSVFAPGGQRNQAAASIEVAKRLQRSLTRRMAALDTTLPRVARLAHPPPPAPEPEPEPSAHEKQRLEAVDNMRVEPYSSLFGVTMSFADFFDCFGPGGPVMVAKMLSLPLDVYKLFDTSHTGKVCCVLPCWVVPLDA